MSILKYEKLHAFINNDAGGNLFIPIPHEEIVETEKRLGFLLPGQIRAFYKEIWYGFLQAPVHSPQNRNDFLVNRIISPSEIADFMLGESRYHPTIPLREGHMPFFDMGESDYLIFKHKSDEPNRVYWFDDKTIVANDFVEFIQRLSDDPRFYLANI